MQTPLTNEQKRGNMDNNAKLRPLYLAKILYEMTDEDHALSTNQLIKLLKEKYNIDSYRTTIA